MTEHHDHIYPPPSAPSAHLPDAELITTHPSTATQKHLADCNYCRMRHQSAQADDAAFEALLAELDLTSAPAATSWSLPAGLRSLIDTAAGPANFASTPRVSEGQLWRLSWRGESQLAVIIQRNSWRVLVAPLSTDTDLADECTLLLAANASTLELPTAIFVRARANVPLYVLDTFLGDVNPEDESLQTAARKVIASQRRRARTIDLRIPTGRELQSTDFDKHEHLIALQERMGWFESAILDVTHQDGSILGEGPELSGVEGNSVSVEDLLNNPEMDYASVSATTGIPLRRLLDLAGGVVQPTPEDSNQLALIADAHVTGSIDEIAVTALIEAVSEPRFRDAREAWNRASNTPETCTVRPLINRLLHQPMAARSTSRNHEVATQRTPDEWRAHWENVITMMLLGRE